MNEKYPSLVEPGVKFFLSRSLINANDYKKKYYNTIFNISLLIGFIMFLSCILVFKYKGKLTEKEKKENNDKTMSYVLSKIKVFQESKRKLEQELITGLPQWDNEYDLLHKKYG